MGKGGVNTKKQREPEEESPLKSDIHQRFAIEDEHTTSDEDAEEFGISSGEDEPDLDEYDEEIEILDDAYGDEYDPAHAPTMFITDTTYDGQEDISGRPPEHRWR